MSDVADQFEVASLVRSCDVSAGRWCGMSDVVTCTDSTRPSRPPRTCRWALETNVNVIHGPVTKKIKKKTVFTQGPEIVRMIECIELLFMYIRKLKTHNISALRSLHYETHRHKQPQQEQLTR